MLGQQRNYNDSGIEKLSVSPSRRSFLHWTGIAAAGVLALPRLSFAKDSPATAPPAPSPKPSLKRPLDPQQFREALAGPIMSLSLIHI